MRIVLLLSVYFIALIANPQWFYKIQKTNSHVYIGYGSNEDSSKAKQEALNDIVSQISVSINSSITNSEQETDGKYKKDYKFTSSQKSAATLYDYKILKSEYYKQKYYVALEYENIPSLDKFTKKILASKLTVKKNEKQNTYINNTNVAKRLKKDLNRDIDFSLQRKDKKWFIKYSSILQPLDKKDFSKFFTSVENEIVEIKTNKKRDILYDGDKFFFKVKSLKNGYVSIFSVYEDGTVSTLVRNVKIVSKKIENIPDEDFETIPEAGLMKAGEETYDMYVVIYSSKKMRFDDFAYADEELIIEEKYKNFDELIEYLDDKTYATLKVVTKPRD